jgi:hypothetical protein
MYETYVKPWRKKQPMIKGHLVCLYWACQTCVNNRKIVEEGETSILKGVPDAFLISLSVHYLHDRRITGWPLILFWAIDRHLLCPFQCSETVFLIIFLFYHRYSCVTIVSTVKHYGEVRSKISVPKDRVVA